MEAAENNQPNKNNNNNKKTPNLTLLLFAFQGGSAVKSVSGSQTAIKPSRSGTVPVIF